MGRRGGRRTEGRPSGRERLGRLGARAVGAVATRVREARADAATRLRGAKASAAAKNAAMLEQAESQRTGSRFRLLVPVAAGFAALAGMFQLVSADVMAVNFTTQNGQFQLYSNYLAAQDAAGYLDSTKRSTATAGTCPQGTGTQTASAGQCGVADLGIISAQLAGLCAIQPESIAGLGNVWSLKLTAGQAVSHSFDPTTLYGSDGGTASTGTNGGAITASGLKLTSTGSIDPSSTGIVSASNLYANTNLLQGYGNLVSGLYLGESADQVATSANADAPTGSTPLTWATDNGGTGPVGGNFGLFAQHLNLAGINGSVFGLQLAGSITLPNLAISVGLGSLSQSNC